MLSSGSFLAIKQQVWLWSYKITWFIVSQQNNKFGCDLVKQSGSLLASKTTSLPWAYKMVVEFEWWAHKITCTIFAKYSKILDRDRRVDVGLVSSNHYKILYVCVLISMLKYCFHCLFTSTTYTSTNSLRLSKKS